MRRAVLIVLVSIALTADLLPGAAIAADADSGSEGSEPSAEPAPKQPPQNGTDALVRASAAYEYGDINQMVEAARLITEGLLPATPAQQSQALRLLGIGLYLTNRLTGAETAFTDLLRREPGARLDPTSTRPEVVAFFENIRHQERAQVQSHRRLIWNFIPPVGQFQNEDSVKGWILLSVGVASAATMLTSATLLKKWQHQDGSTFDHPDTARTVDVVQWTALGVLAATYVYGVVDGLLCYGKPLDEPKASFSFRLTPNGGLGFTF